MSAVVGILLCLAAPGVLMMRDDCRFFASGYFVANLIGFISAVMSMPWVVVTVGLMQIWPMFIVGWMSIRKQIGKEWSEDRLLALFGGVWLAVVASGYVMHNLW